MWCINSSTTSGGEILQKVLEKIKIVRGKPCEKLKETMFHTITQIFAMRNLKAQLRKVWSGFPNFCKTKSLRINKWKTNFQFDLLVPILPVSCTLPIPALHSLKHLPVICPSFHCPCCAIPVHVMFPFSGR